MTAWQLGLPGRAPVGPSQATPYLRFGAVLPCLDLRDGVKTFGFGNVRA